MGRITIFSIEECNFCRRTKAALSACSIPYTDINIEYYPSKRSDMISLTDRLTVPQVFFNDEHIGGADDALAILQKWDDDIAANDDDCMDKSPLERYIRVIESKPDPADERLSIPTSGVGPDTVQSMDFSASRTSEIFQSGDKQYTTLEFTKLLMQRMPRDSLSYWGCLYYNVFKGSSGVTALQRLFNYESRDEAVQLGMSLQRKHYLCHVCKDHVFGDNGYYFRLQPFHTPNILNSFRKWCDPVNDEPMLVIHRLGKLWSKLESRHLDEDGMVDHATIRNDDMYWKFEEEVCELQCINLQDMDDRKRMAFVINLYNVFIKYAFCKVGIPATSRNRASFFDDVWINVGGCSFSFNDLEHGILRANTRHPYQLTKPFGVRDSRKRLSLKKFDKRIHFALNCGAKSCPPVKKYTVEAIEEELRLAAMAFCEQEDNVAIVEESRQLHLSKILYWYMSDFVRSKDELPQMVAQYLRGEKKERLDKLMGIGNVSLKFLDYDWSSNDINCHEFQKGDLNDKSIFPYPGNPPSQKYELTQD
ncbi:hypothetical protein ACHAXR_010227 [Thalassiosira sp. AJA248-18]